MGPHRLSKAENSCELSYRAACSAVCLQAVFWASHKLGQTQLHFLIKSGMSLKRHRTACNLVYTEEGNVAVEPVHLVNIVNR